MNFLQVIVAWFKKNFVWSNEDFCFIVGGFTTLQQIHFDPNSTIFALTIAAILKGAMSMFSVTLGNAASEDIVLIIGGFVTMSEIGFNIHNPIFWVTLGAIVKAGFGIFGFNIVIPVIQAPPVNGQVPPPTLLQTKSPLVIAKESLEASKPTPSTYKPILRVDPPTKP